MALSASDLLTADEKERERHVTSIRARLDEISRTLRIAVPVYVLVTKCDLVAGFSEFFDDLDRDIERIEPKLQIRSSGENWFDLSLELADRSLLVQPRVEERPRS